MTAPVVPSLRAGLVLVVALLLGLSLIVTLPSPADAATISVNTTDDELDIDGDCSLREAILAANTNAAVDGCLAGEASPTVDIIDLPAGTYAIAIAGTNENAGMDGDLDVTEALEIRGAGAATTIIDGGAIERVFDVGASLALDGVTVRNGSSTGNGGGILADAGTLTIANSVIRANSANSGGGIYITSPVAGLTVTASTIADNQASSDGGGIYDTTGGATLSITGTLVTDNDAVDDGGGFYHTSNSPTSIVDSTFSGNTAGNDGGAIYNTASTAGTISIMRTTLSGNAAGDAANDDGGAIYHTGAAVDITNSTLSGNSAGDRGGAVYCTSSAGLAIVNTTLAGNSAPNGGGVFLSCDDTAITLANTIIANSAAGGDCDSGAPTSLGNNLDSDGTCNLSAAGDISTGNAGLGPLANNGGPTFTHALVTGSDAIDAGSDLVCTAAPVNGDDQRGESRPADGDGDGDAACDIGAYELQPAAPQPTAEPTASPADPLPDTAVTGGSRSGSWFPIALVAVWGGGMAGWALMLDTRRAADRSRWRGPSL